MYGVPVEGARYRPGSGRAESSGERRVWGERRRVLTLGRGPAPRSWIGRSCCFHSSIGPPKTSMGPRMSGYQLRAACRRWFGVRLWNADQAARSAI
jgi:hypothetical protein